MLCSFIVLRRFFSLSLLLFLRGFRFSIEHRAWAREILTHVSVGFLVYSKNYCLKDGLTDLLFDLRKN